ncbi:hypothetical protein DL96DRAFT_274436 [Flagelloscypha sp. PMI_526]|nr:hypothetical protein DL96DRAFT_274436 [Flagelloscypha sp. PMI_526]
MATDESLTYQRKYTLTSKELDTLSHHLLHSRPPKTSDQFVCYLLEDIDEVSNLGRYVEKEVFADMFGSTDATMIESLGVYEHASLFFVVLDTVRCRPAGVLRIVKNSSAGLPTLNDAPKYIGVTLDMFQEHHKVEGLDTVWDLSTAAVSKEYRRVEKNLVGHMLFRAVEVRAAYEGVEHYVAIVDKHAKRAFAPLGWVSDPIAGSRPVEYEGSTESTFNYRHRITAARHVAENVERVKNQFKSSAELFKRRFVDGEGIDHRFMFQFSKVTSNCAGKRYAKL